MKVYRKSRIEERWGRAFVLIELLVVVAVISLLISLLIPALRSAREQGWKTVCLSNHRQLIMAWLAYASEYDGNIVDGNPGRMTKTIRGSRVIRIKEGWLGRAFWNPASHSELIHNPDKGALWPWIRNLGVYRCPRGRAGPPSHVQHVDLRQRHGRRRNVLAAVIGVGHNQQTPRKRRVVSDKTDGY